MPTDAEFRSRQTRTASRRRFLRSSSLAALGTAAGSGSLLAQTGSTDGVGTLQRVAAILTERPGLDGRLVASAWLALADVFPDFQERLDELAAAISQDGVRTARDFTRSDGAKQPTLAETARRIVGALYTGRVGEGQQARLVAFETALMYAPTRDVTVVPTYARGSRDYWVAPPATRG